MIKQTLWQPRKHKAPLSPSDLRLPENEDLGSDNQLGILAGNFQQDTQFSKPSVPQMEKKDGKMSTGHKCHEGRMSPRVPRSGHTHKTHTI